MVFAELRSRVKTVYLDDMVKRFGVDEMLQLTDCAEDNLTNEARSIIETALADASATMNRYLAEFEKSLDEM